MIAASYSDAVNAMFAVANTVFSSAEVLAAVGYKPVIRFQDVYAAQPDASKIWGRVSYRNSLTRQTKLSPCGTPQKKRYTTTGFLYVQLFGPSSQADTAAKMRKFATLLRDAYHGHTAGDSVWFRGVTVLPLDPEDQMTRCNVVAGFEYDELA